MTMPEQFEHIADYGRHACVLDDPARIRARGTRRIRRRRAGQAVVGTGAIAVIAGLGAGLFGHGATPAAKISAASGPTSPRAVPVAAASGSPEPSGLGPSAVTTPSESPGDLSSASASPGGGAAIPGPGTVTLPADARITISRDGTVEDYYADVQAPGAAEDVFGLSATRDGALHSLEALGFSHVTLEADSSPTTYERYPVDYVTDIRNSAGQSVLGKPLTTETALVIVYCADPNS